MKRNVMLSMLTLMIVVCFFAESPEIYGQEPATGAPKAPAKSAPPTKQVTLDIVFGAFKTYKHPSGWFSMSVPENWTITEKSLEDEYIISIMDPTENAAFVGRVWSGQDQMTADELENILTTFLNDSLGDFKNFTLGDPISKSGKVGISFTYDSVVEGKFYPMIGESFIEQNGRISGVTNFILPKDQYDKKKDLVNKMIKSIKISSN